MGKVSFTGLHALGERGIEHLEYGQHGRILYQQYRLIRLVVQPLTLVFLLLISEQFYLADQFSENLQDKTLLLRLPKTVTQLVKRHLKALIIQPVSCCHMSHQPHSALPGFCRQFLSLPEQNRVENFSLRIYQLRLKLDISTHS
jgi:hypothetical protein